MIKNSAYTYAKAPYPLTVEVYGSNSQGKLPAGRQNKPLQQFPVVNLTAAERANITSSLAASNKRSSSSNRSSGSGSGGIMSTRSSIATGLDALSSRLAFWRGRKRLHRKHGGGGAGAAAAAGGRRLAAAAPAATSTLQQRAVFPAPKWQQQQQQQQQGNGVSSRRRLVEQAPAGSKDADAVLAAYRVASAVGPGPGGCCGGCCCSLGSAAGCCCELAPLSVWSALKR